MLKATLEEDRANPDRRSAELEIVLLARHPGDDVADSAPRVETAVEELKLRLARLEAEEAESGAEQSDAGAIAASGLALHLPCLRLRSIA